MTKPKDKSKDRSKDKQNNLQELVSGFSDIMKSIANQQEQELKERKNYFLTAIPKEAKSIYVHCSHRFMDCLRLIERLEEQYNSKNILVTTAPDSHNQTERMRQLGKPVSRFQATKGIDAVIYLCHGFCDGYSLYGELEIADHIWHAIRTAQKYQTPLIVGYQNDFCFQTRCPEREYVTTPEQVKVPCSIIGL